MSDKNKIIVASFLILLSILFLNREKLENWITGKLYPETKDAKDEKDDVVLITNSDNTSSNTSSNFTNDTLLKKGDKGSKVEALQKLINKGLKQNDGEFWEVAEDRIFGGKTESALMMLTGRKSISINGLTKLL